MRGSEYEWNRNAPLAVIILLLLVIPSASLILFKGQHFSFCEYYYSLYIFSDVLKYIVNI